MIRIGHIDFINAIPLDIEDSHPRLDFIKVSAVPSLLNKMLLNNEIDISMVSSAFFLRHTDTLIRIGNFGIVSNGPVMSVLLLSNIDLTGIPRTYAIKVYETPKSATSVILNRLILKHNFGLENISFSDQKDAHACLLIGDEALGKLVAGTYPHIYDLGMEWKRWTGLPMVFAVLAANINALKEKKDDLETYIKILEERYRESKSNMASLVERAEKRVSLPRELLFKYYNCLQYEIGEKEDKSLALFHELTKELLSGKETDETSSQTKQKI